MIQQYIRRSLFVALAFVQSLTFAADAPQSKNSPALPPTTQPVEVPSPTVPGAKTWLNLVYASPGGSDIKLDLRLPLPGAKPAPVVVWIHGGAWSAGNRTFCPMSPLVAKGYAVASIDYRLVKQGVFPTQIYDCKAAIRWLRAHAGEYNLDANRIGVSGESAGGQLAALLGTSGGAKELEGDGGNAELSSRVQAVCDLCGPTNFVGASEDPDLASAMKLLTSSDPKEASKAKLILSRQLITTQYFGGPVAEHQKEARNASPMSFVAKDNPPFFIVHGDKDNLVPLSQSQTFAEALKKVGVPVQLEIVPGAGHGFGKLKPEMMEKVMAFFDKYLK